jgi:hypothetical protein
MNEGGGNFAATEHVIQTLMLDAGLLGDLPPLTAPMHDADRPGAAHYRATPEIFAGYLRGSMGNVEGYGPESEVHYDDPGIYVEGRFYVGGDWSNDREDLRLVGEKEGQIVVRYGGLDVDVVIAASGKADTDIKVHQDGSSLTAENRGEDVHIDADGRSLLTVGEARSYNVVRNREHGEHILKLTAPRGGVSLYSFSFAAGAIPELISG